ncbi:MAG: hypothetical protein RR510_07655 [Morganella sp. (in: enterobacteria)]
MEPVQGTQANQVLQHMDNEIYSSAGTGSSSSYVSLSGIKEILSNAWDAIKSAFSNMLSSFGNHLSGQQGSTKPGREITMDMSSRPAQPLPGIDEQIENAVYESSGENIYDELRAETAPERPESLYALVDDKAPIHERKAPLVPTSQYPSLSELYSEPLYEEIVDSGIQEPASPPIPTSARPLLPGRSAESAEMEPVYQSSDENIYSKPYETLEPISTPENDPRGDSDYDDPKTLSLNEQAQKRIMSERRNTI